MSQNRFENWHLDLQDLLGLAVPPVAIAFLSHAPAGIARIERTRPPATADGRTGAVAASCVFWIDGTQGVFATTAEDHGNCSVGGLTHGFKTMEEIAHNADVAALCETGWVTPEAVAKLAAVREKPTHVVYGPLRDMPVEPSVILLRLNGKQQMLLHDAWPGSLRGQAAVPHHSDRQRARGDRRERRLHAQPGAHRDVEQRGDLRDPGEPGALADRAAARGARRRYCGCGLCRGGRQALCARATTVNENEHLPRQQKWHCRMLSSGDQFGLRGTRCSQDVSPSLSSATIWLRVA